MVVGQSKFQKENNPTARVLIRKKNHYHPQVPEPRARFRVIYSDSGSRVLLSRTTVNQAQAGSRYSLF